MSDTMQDARPSALMPDARRQAWSDAAVEAAGALLRGMADPLSALASRLLVVAEADEAVWARTLPGSAPAVVVAVAGSRNGLALGDPVPLDDGPIGAVLRSGLPRLLPEAAEDAATGPGMAVPTRSDGRVDGALLVRRRACGPPFDESDLDLLSRFADQVSALIALAEARSARERAALVEDRARIARDLHDTVIQQLFAAGLELRAVATALPAGDQADGVRRVLELVDLAVDEIRNVVLPLPFDTGGDSIRQRVLHVVRDLRLPFRVAPSLVFEGPVDLVVRQALADDVVAVVRESLANAARHASADHVAVSVAAVDGVVQVEVRDDGVGLPEHHRHRGLTNLATRARERGGGVTISSADPGTRVVWRVPFHDDGGAS